MRLEDSTRKLVDSLCCINSLLKDMDTGKLNLFTWLSPNKANG